MCQRGERCWLVESVTRTKGVGERAGRMMGWRGEMEQGEALE